MRNMRSREFLTVKLTSTERGLVSSTSLNGRALTVLLNPRAGNPRKMFGMPLTLSGHSTRPIPLSQNPCNCFDPILFHTSLFRLDTPGLTHILSLSSTDSTGLIFIPFSQTRTTSTTCSAPLDSLSSPSSMSLSCGTNFLQSAITAAGGFTGISPSC